MSQAGKGDKRRPENKTTSDKNYDKIDWSRKKNHNVDLHEKVQPKQGKSDE